MKNLFIYALSIISLAAFSQNKNALLYRISGNGIAQPSYIFGTIHLTCDATLDLATIKALDETSQMYLELDMDDPEMQMNMMKSMNMRNGTTLKTLLSAEDYEILDNYLKLKMNISVSLFNNYKPFFLSSMFLSGLLDCAAQSFESELVKISTFQNEPVFGLETVEDQMNIFDEIPYDVQVSELMKSVKNDFKDDKKEFQLLMSTYAKKDLKEMQRLSDLSSSAIMSDFQDVLLVNRNKKWITKMKQITKEKPTFFGVGALHLSGNEGIIQLLRKEGYKVEAVIN